MLVTFNGAEPLFVSAKLWAALVVPTRTVPKSSEPFEKETSGATPVPDKFTVCGLPAALSISVRPPEFVPVLVGVKVTLIVQVAPTASEFPQLLVCAKAPVAVMLVIVRGAVPLLPKVRICGALVVLSIWLGKLKVPPPLENVITGVTPLPIRPAFSAGIPPCATVRKPLRVPVTVGVNATFATQLAPTASDAGQLFVCE